MNDEVKKYLKQNEDKLSKVPKNEDDFAQYCHCFLWDNLKDMEEKSLSMKEIKDVVTCLDSARLSVNFDMEIRWGSDAFPEIDPSVFTESKRPVTVVIKTNEKAPCLMPFTILPLAGGNVVSGKSSPDVEPSESPANSKADDPFDKPK